MTTPQAIPQTEAEHHLHGVQLMLDYAIEAEHPAMIVYVAAGGEQTTRAGHQIVRTMDRRSGEPRTFRLDRIADIVVLAYEEFVLDRAERDALDRIRAEIRAVAADGYAGFDGFGAMRWSPGDPIFIP
jgi:hypothetical protein